MPRFLVLVDSAPIIYMLEANSKLAAHFAPLFQRHADGEIALAINADARVTHDRDFSKVRGIRVLGDGSVFVTGANQIDTGWK